LPIVMQVPGITGDIVESAHSGWCRILSMSWRARRALSVRTMTDKDRESAIPAISEVEFTRENDIASGPIMQKFFTGEAQATVQFDFVRTDTALDIYFSLILTDAIFSMFEQGSGGERPTETLKINFTKIQTKSTQMSALGTGAGPFSTGYDLAASKAL